MSPTLPPPVQYTVASRYRGGYIFSFPGIRYAPVDRENGPDMILIYDVNGFIAGMHSVVLKRFSHENWQSGSIWYIVLFYLKIMPQLAFSNSVICGISLNTF